MERMWEEMELRTALREHRMWSTMLGYASLRRREAVNAKNEVALHTAQTEVDDRTQKLHRCEDVLISAIKELMDLKHGKVQE